MSKREYRRFTAEQKIEILREADQPGVTVSEVCRRHGLSPSVLYRWRVVAPGGPAVALRRATRPRPSGHEPWKQRSPRRTCSSKKRSEAGRFIQSSSGDESPRDAA